MKTTNNQKRKSAPSEKAKPDAARVGNTMDTYYLYFYGRG